MVLHIWNFIVRIERKEEDPQQLKRRIERKKIEEEIEQMKD